ncbi:MAG: hypothetical protein QF752_06685 [Planctomycetota bacterium]|jgi:hypothetical protein|nr:hypothetical protein [Planctomycetota bacterium]
MRNLLTLSLAFIFIALTSLPVAAESSDQAIEAMKRAAKASNELGSLVKNENEFYTYYYWRRGRALLRYALRFHLRGEYTAAYRVARRSWCYTTYPQRSANWWREQAIAYLQDSVNDQVDATRTWVNGFNYLKGLYTNSTSDYERGAYWYARTKAITMVDKLTSLHQSHGNTSTESAAYTYVKSVLVRVEKRNEYYNSYFDENNTDYVFHNRNIPTSLIKNAKEMSLNGNLLGALFMARVGNWRISYVRWVNWLQENRVKLQQWVASGLADQHLRICFGCFIGWCHPMDPGHIAN